MACPGPLAAPGRRGTGRGRRYRVVERAALLAILPVLLAAGTGPVAGAALGPGAGPFVAVHHLRLIRHAPTTASPATAQQLPADQKLREQGPSSLDTGDLCVDAGSMSEEQPYENLRQNDSWAFLRSAPVGRLAVIMGDEPEIFPINYLVDDRSVGSEPLKAPSLPPPSVTAWHWNPTDTIPTVAGCGA